MKPNTVYLKELLCLESKKKMKAKFLLYIIKSGMKIFRYFLSDSNPMLNAAPFPPPAKPWNPRVWTVADAAPATTAAAAAPTTVCPPTTTIWNSSTKIKLSSEGKMPPFLVLRGLNRVK